MKRATITLLILTVLIFSAFSTTNARGQQGQAALGVAEVVEVAPGMTVQVPVVIRDVEALYGLEFFLDFDPTLVRVVDADLAVSGVQVALGEFLDPGLLLFNEADNSKGTLHFAMAQYNPSEPKTGTGIIVVVTFEGIKDGKSPLTMRGIALSTRDGDEIPSRALDSTIEVLPGAPTQAATYPAAESTGLILIQTFTPTPVPTNTPLPTFTATISPSLAVESTTTSSTVTDESEDQRTSYFLVDNWWIVLLASAAVAGFGFWTIKKRK